MSIRTARKTHHIIVSLLLTICALGVDGRQLRQANENQESIIEVQQQDTEEPLNEQQLDRNSLEALNDILEILRLLTENELDDLLRKNIILAPLRIYRDNSMSWSIENFGPTRPLKGAPPAVLELVNEIRVYLYDVSNISVRKADDRVDFRLRVNFPRILINYTSFGDFHEIVKAPNYEFALGIHFTDVQRSIVDLKNIAEWWGCSHVDEAVTEILASAVWLIVQSHIDNVLPAYETASRWCHWLKTDKMI